MTRATILSKTIILLAGATITLLLTACTQADPTPMPPRLIHDVTPTPAPTSTPTATPKRQPTPSPTPTVTKPTTLEHTSTPVTRPRSPSDPEAFCYRTPAVQRVILKTLQSNSCYGITAAELFRIEYLYSEQLLEIPSNQLKAEDFEGLVNLKWITITG